MVATLHTPLVLIAGKEFSEAFEFATSPTGAADNLDDTPAWEFRARKRGQTDTSFVWSTETGELTVVEDQVQVFVSDTITDPLKPTTRQPEIWDWLLSSGADEPETPRLEGTMLIKGEP